VSNFDKNDFLPQAFVVLGVITFVLNFGALPESVPIHFGLTGHPNGWAPKPVALIVPVLAVGLYLLLSAGRASGKFNLPWKLNDANRDQLVELCREFLWTSNVLVSAMLAYLQWAMIQIALHRMEGVGAWFTPVFIGGMLLLHVVYFVRGQRIVGRAKS